MAIADIGEFGLIDLLTQIVQPLAGVASFGIGDDAAVLPWNNQQYLLATVDMLVEGVHFRREAISAADLGRRALAVNLSDIAAMGGTPTYALVSLGLPPALPTVEVEELYRGLTSEAREYGVVIVGGNIARHDQGLLIDVLLLGNVEQHDVLFRSGARPGDVLAVTGDLGAAAAGLGLQRRPELQGQLATAKELLRRQQTPQPRVRAGQVIARSHLAHAMIDLSDGLAGDAHHLARASSLGVIVEEALLPIAAATQTAATLLGVSPAELALHGGEDYELLVALPPENVPVINDSLRAVGEPILTVVGSVTAGDGVKLRRCHGEIVDLKAGGFRHF
jgi:thiamine-monophosphate kinase